MGVFYSVDSITCKMGLVGKQNVMNRMGGSINSVMEFQSSTHVSGVKMLNAVGMVQKNPVCQHSPDSHVQKMRWAEIVCSYVDFTVPCQCFPLPLHFVVLGIQHGGLHSERRPFLTDVGEHEWTHFSQGFIMEDIIASCRYSSTASVAFPLQNPKYKFKIHIGRLFMEKWHVYSYFSLSAYHSRN
jgi:hypothetical protein